MVDVDNAVARKVVEVVALVTKGDTVVVDVTLVVIIVEVVSVVPVVVEHSKIRFACYH